MYRYHVPSRPPGTSTPVPTESRGWGRDTPKSDRRAGTHLPRQRDRGTTKTTRGTGTYLLPDRGPGARLPLDRGVGTHLPRTTMATTGPPGVGASTFVDRKVKHSVLTSDKIFSSTSVLKNFVEVCFSSLLETSLIKSEKDTPFLVRTCLDLFQFSCITPFSIFLRLVEGISIFPKERIRQFRLYFY